jgi:hypothetical protein
MSHNVRLQNIKFTDLGILSYAVDEINRELGSTQYTLVREPTVARGWMGNDAKVDAAIKCPGAYDIGFTHDRETGNYVPYLESMFHDSRISAQPGSETVEGKACEYSGEAAMLGRLSQRYAIIQAEMNAARNGMVTQRIPGENGQIHLEVTN